jgi:hypothetical protein
MSVRMLWLPVVLILVCAGWSVARVTPPSQTTSDPCCANLYFTMTPWSISFPAYTKPFHEKDTVVAIHNITNTDVIFSSVVVHEDSCKGPGCVTRFLGYTGLLTVLHPDSTFNLTVQLNKSGVITNTTAPHRLWGRIVFTYNGDPSPWTLPVNFVVADSVADVKFDTLTTMTTIKLVVASNGNMGNNYADSVNMNFNPTIECDTGDNMRGNAWTYLGDASPVIVRKVGTAPACGSWSIFSQGYTNPNGFKPLPPGTPSNPLHGNPPKDSVVWWKYHKYFSGTFVTVDSLLKIEKTWYAPLISIDSSNFIIEKMQVWPAKQATLVTNVAIGEAYDWDIPSDSTPSYNAGGYDASRRLVYQKGFNSLDTVTDCFNNGLRYGGVALIGMTNQKFIDCDSGKYMTDSLYGGYTARNDSFVYPAGGFVPEQLWTNMQRTGYYNQDGPDTWADLHTVLVFRNVEGTGFSFPAKPRDTFTVYAVMGVVRNAVSEAAGLDSLKSVIDKGKAWTHFYVTNKIVFGTGCDCFPTKRRGDVNYSGIVDLADLSGMVSYLTGGGYEFQCYCCADVNASEIVDLADLSAMVSYLTGGGYVLPNCA